MRTRSGQKRGQKKARNENKCKIYEAAKRDQKSRHEEHVNHGAKYALPHGNFHPTESRVHGAVDPAHVCARTEDISMWEGRAAEWKGGTKEIRWRDMARGRMWGSNVQARNTYRETASSGHVSSFPRPYSQGFADYLVARRGRRRRRIYPAHHLEVKGI